MFFILQATIMIAQHWAMLQPVSIFLVLDLAACFARFFLILLVNDAWGRAETSHSPQLLEPSSRLRSQLFISYPFRNNVYCTFIKKFLFGGCGWGFTSDLTSHSGFVSGSDLTFGLEASLFLPLPPHFAEGPGWFFTSGEALAPARAELVAKLIGISLGHTLKLQWRIY